MGELWFQFLPRNPADLAILRRDYAEKYALSDNPAFASAHYVLSSIYTARNDVP